MTILELHNHFRVEKALSELLESTILQFYAEKSSKWMARRQFFSLWNFDQVRYNLIKEHNFIEVDYNIAVGSSSDVVMKHILNNLEKKEVIFGNFTHIGIGNFRSNYLYWTILYGKMKEES